MKMCKRIQKCILLAVVSCFLTACMGESVEVKENIFSMDQTAKERESMLEEASLDYEVPETYPSISVSLGGYETGKDKVAVLSARTLPAAFEVKNFFTGEVVYKGSVKRKDTIEEDGLSTGIADFSGLDSEGFYYIETEILGKSKGFPIAEGVYESLLLESYQKLHKLRCEGCHEEPVKFENSSLGSLDVKGGWHTDKNGGKDVVEGCLAVLDICTSFDYYSGSYTDDYGTEDSGNKIPDILDEAAYEVGWLLLMQNPETGGVYTSVSLDQSGENLVVRGETTKATAYFCTCMAKFSQTIKKYDSKLSSRAISAATLSWKCLEANKDIVTADQMYRAAAELYKVTGQETCGKVVSDYLKDNAGNSYEGRLTMDGAITYLSTARNTSVDYCTKLMSTFVTLVEKKASTAKESRYLVYNTEEDTEDILRDAFEFAIVDYINTSDEYVSESMSFVDYICGRNALSKNYFNDINTPDALAKMISVTARIQAPDK